MGSALSTDAVRWQRVACFYGLACSGAVLCGYGASNCAGTLSKVGMSVAMMLTPSLAGVLVQRGLGEPLGEALGLRRGALFGRWGLASLLFPCAFVGASTAVSVAVPGVRCAPGEALLASSLAAGATEAQLEQLRAIAASPPLALALKSLLQAVLAGGSLNILPCLGEEAGWRGWLLRELAPLGFWPAALLSGAMWGLWHAPLVLQGHNYPQHPGFGVAMMTAFCTLLSPAMTLLRWRSRSVLASAAFHGVLNAAAGLPLLLLAGGNDLNVGSTGWPGLLLLAVADAAIFAAYGPAGVLPCAEDSVAAVKDQ